MYKIIFVDKFWLHIALISAWHIHISNNILRRFFFCLIAIYIAYHFQCLSSPPVCFHPLFGIYVRWTRATFSVSYTYKYTRNVHY